MKTLILASAALFGAEFSIAMAQQQPTDLPPIAQACVQQWQRAAGESMDFQAQLIDARKQIAELQKQVAAAKPADATPPPPAPGK